MAKEKDNIIQEITGLLKAKNIQPVALNTYNIVRGMNAKIIAELYIYINKPRQSNRKSTNDVSNISNDDLVEIYNNISSKPEENISAEALMELKYTLLRYWNVYPNHG